MKVCTVCKLEKTNNDFYFRDKATNKLHSQCKLCYSEKRRKLWKIYYYKHGSKYRENANLRNKKLKDKLRHQMMQYLSDKSCVICGVSDPRILEFDHINPKMKSFSISRAITNVLSWETILNEIEKCQVLCANCHKIKTAEENDWYRHTYPK